MLDMGQIERKIAKDAMRFGGKLPDRIANAPQLLPGLDLYLQGFFDLTNSRQANFDSMGYIVWSEIAKYTEFYCLGKEQKEDFIYLVTQLDFAYVNKQNEKIRQKEKQSNGSKSSKSKK